MPLLTHYAGTLNTEDRYIIDALLNTDNYPRIEYLAPINHRLEKAGQLTWFAEEQLFEFIEPYSKKQVLHADSYLERIDPAWYGVIEAGYFLHLSHMLRNKQHKDADSVEFRYRSLLKKAAVALVPEAGKGPPSNL